MAVPRCSGSWADPYGEPPENEPEPDGREAKDYGAGLLCCPWHRKHPELGGECGIDKPDVICRQCATNPVEPDRQSWATPVCKGCLPDCRHGYCSRANRGTTRKPTQEEQYTWRVFDDAGSEFASKTMVKTDTGAKGTEKASVFDNAMANHPDLLDALDYADPYDVMKALADGDGSLGDDAEDEDDDE